MTAAALTLSATSAHADTASAQQSFQEGLRRYDARDYAGAADAFGAAYADAHEESYLWNLAVCELRLGRYAEALKHFRACKEDPAASQEHAARVDGFIAAARAHLGHLVIDAPAGTRIDVDGEDVGTAPLSSSVDVTPDVSHTVHARAETQLVTTAVGAPGTDTVAVHVAFQQPPTPVAAPVLARTAAEAAPRAPRETSPARVLTVVAIGAAAAGAFVAGFVYARASNSDSDHASSLRLATASQAPPGSGSSYCSTNANDSGCAALSRAIDDQSTDFNTSRALYIASGVLVAGGVAVFLLWPTAAHERRESTLWIAPGSSGAARGLSLGGAF